jgi:metal-responsive CopG/Arc/MetJ family transcriptional regulator
MADRHSPAQYFMAASRAKRGSTSQLISVRLPEDLVQRLAEVGNEEGLAMSDTIRVVLERGLSKSRGKKGTS